MISDLDRLSLRYSSSYLSRYLFIILPSPSLVFIWSPKSLTIHPCRNMTYLPFVTQLSPTSLLTLFLRQTCKHMALDSGVLISSHSILSTWAISSTPMAPNTSYGKGTHIYSFGLDLSLSLSSSITGSSPACLSLRNLRVTSNAGPCQHSQRRRKPSALPQCTSSFPLFPTSCSSTGLHPGSPVCYLSHDVFQVQTIRLYWVSTTHILLDTRDMKMIHTWTQFSRT